MPLPQWDNLDTLLDELFWIYRRPPAIFYKELVSREIISPVAHVHTAHPHSQYTVLCAMSNLLVMILMTPLNRPPLHCMLCSIEIICNCEYFNISRILGHSGGASSLEASPSSIIHSNWYAKVQPLF